MKNKNSLQIQFIKSEKRGYMGDGGMNEFCFCLGVRSIYRCNNREGGGGGEWRKTEDDYNE